MVMQLLSHVPEFKKDVSEARKEFEIERDGFRSFDELDNWANKNNFWDYEKDYSRSPFDIIKDFPSNKFQKEMLKIGIKYLLPFNFYGQPYRGVPYFILMNEIQSPEENYDVDFRTNGDTLLYTSLVVYKPLNKTEAKNAMSHFLEIQRDIFPYVYKNADTFVKKRGRANIERDLALIEEQLARSGKPKKVESFVLGSYLDIVNKSRTASTRRLRSLKRSNKESVVVGYDNPTSRQIGKKHGVSGESTRQAKKRLNSIAEELFGYDLEP